MSGLPVGHTKAGKANLTGQLVDLTMVCGVTEQEQTVLNKLPKQCQRQVLSTLLEIDESNPANDLARPAYFNFIDSCIEASKEQHELPSLLGTLSGYKGREWRISTAEFADALKVGLQRIPDVCDETEVRSQSTSVQNIQRDIIIDEHSDEIVSLIEVIRALSV